MKKTSEMTLRKIALIPRSSSARVGLVRTETTPEKSTMAMVSNATAKYGTTYMLKQI
jgi:hypothetical protein